jgi:photosystem II stability/assembly factor-like uncharacterized protein
MKRLHRFLFSFIAASIVFLAASQGFSQWVKVFYTGVSSAPVNSGFFFNELTGIIGSYGDIGIFKTTDGGKSWTKAKIPAGYNNRITQIFMTDNLRGWATIEDVAAKQCIWQTVDGGLTWTATGPVGSYNNIYETPSAVIALSRNLDPGPPYFPVLTSTNSGASFNATAMTLKNGIDFTDNLHGVITGFTISNGSGTRSNWEQTNDGGKTWTQISPIQNVEAWSVYADKGTSNFYAAPEANYPSHGVTTILKSTDFGTTWTSPATLNFLTTGHIGGVGEILYVQADHSDNSTASGIYRSVDHGVNWVSVAGPTNYRDTRFVVTGCIGGIVYAFDSLGNVWKTRSGGDGTIIEPPVEPVIQGNPIVFSGPICSTSFASLDIENLYCSDDTILSATIVDTTSAIFKSGALTVSASPAFPLWLPPNTRDSLRFIWQPSKIFNRDTMVSFQVKVRYYSKILNQTFDTLVTVQVHAIGEPPNADISPLDLNFHSISFCAPKDTTVTITNHSCDTIHVYNSNPNASSSYQLFDSNRNVLTFPLEIPPGDNDKIIVHLKVDSAGNYSSTIQLKIYHQGIEKDTTITISAQVSSSGSFSLADSLNFDSVSTCIQVDSLLQLKNLSCIPITVTNISLKNHSVFTLVSSPTVIAPNTTGTIDIKFSPNAQQQDFDTLTLVFNALGEQQTRKIVIKGIGVVHPAKFVLSVTSDTLFNTSLTRCDSPMVYRVKISNPGCQKISIIKAELQGTPTPDISLVSGTLNQISDGASDSVMVIVTPKLLGSFSGFLHINYQVYGGNARDTSLAYFLTVGYGPRLLAVDHDTIDLGTMRLCDMRDSAVTIQDIGCDTLNVTAVSIQGNGTFTLTGAPVQELATHQQATIPFHFEPIGAGNILGTLTVSTISDSIPIRKITIIAHVIPTDTITFTMVPTRKVFDADDTLTVSLIPNQNIHGRGLHDISFTINYNGDLTTLLDPPLGAQSGYGTVLQPPAGGTPKHTTVRIGLVGNSTLELDSGVAAITFRYYVRLTDSISTGFDLSNIVLNGGDPQFAKCDLGIIAASMTYQLTYLCGDSLIVKLLQLGKNLKIFADAVYPNPLTEQDNFQGIIPFTTSSGGEFSLEVYDNIGRRKLADHIQTQQAGKYYFTIDGRALTGGCYNYRLVETTNPAASVRGRFIIAK